MSIGACLAVVLLGAAEVVIAGGTPQVDQQVRADAGRGRARVILELRTPHPIQAEGTLQHDRDRVRQREEIAAAQDAAIARLAGTDVVVIRRFATQPLLALEIGPSALAALETMGDLVTRVLPDAVARPTEDAR